MVGTTSTRKHLLARLDSGIEVGGGQVDHVSRGDLKALKANPDLAIDLAAVALCFLFLAFGSWWEWILSFTGLCVFLRFRGWEGDI